MSKRVVEENVSHEDTKAQRELEKREEKIEEISRKGAKTQSLRGEERELPEWCGARLVAPQGVWGSAPAAKRFGGIENE